MNGPSKISKQIKCLFFFIFLLRNISRYSSSVFHCFFLFSSINDYFLYSNISFLNYYSIILGFFPYLFYSYLQLYSTESSYIPLYHHISSYLQIYLHIFIYISIPPSISPYISLLLAISYIFCYYGQRRLLYTAPTDLRRDQRLFEASPCCVYKNVHLCATG